MTKDERKGPVFVVGMNGSGTTMILDHLGQHPRLYAYPVETYVLPHFLQTQSRFGDLSHDSNFRRLWDEMRSSYVFRWRNRGEPVELPADWRDMQRSAAGVFDRIMQHYASQVGKSRWAEKTPTHVLHMTTLAEAFEDAVFIHMVRDGRDCAASNHRRWRRHPVGTIHRWKEVVAEGRRQGESLGDRYMELRYEDVTEAPIRYLEQACRFMGLEFDERVCRTQRSHRHIETPSTKTIVRNRSRRDTYFSVKQRQELERVAGRQLQMHGYQPEFHAGDEEPAALARSWWVVHDGAHAALRHFKRVANMNNRMTMQLMWRRWKTIIQNKVANMKIRAK